MRTVLCTLYNSLYLDKGLVLYDSLVNCCHDFVLYVLCMDDKCYEVLSDLKQCHLIPIRLSDFEKGDIALLEAKTNRPFGEYCWTCSSSLIKYVLCYYNEPICTYIDADMLFYHDPQILIDELIQSGKCVMVTPHRFPKENEKQADVFGTYCVEFNTFINCTDGLEVLEYWRNRCLECCSNIGDGVHWGDQKYLDELVEKFGCVYVCQNPGAGVALWNIKLYENANIDNQSMIRVKKTGAPIPLVFYHFQNVTYITHNVVSTSIEKKSLDVDYTLVDKLYKDYLKKIEDKKKYLYLNYRIKSYISVHPSIKIYTGSKLKKFLKQTILYKMWWPRMMKKKSPFYLVKVN